MNQDQLRQHSKEEARRAILQFLYDAGGKFRAKRVRIVLARMSICNMLWSEYVDNLDHLVRKELIRIFPADARRELSVDEQGDYMDLVRRMSFDDVECEMVTVRIRDKGRDFIEGNAPDVKGVATE